MSLAERRWLRLFTLCILYVAQGIPWGFMATTLPSYIASKGVDAGVVGTTLAMTTLPYTFKWVWGPIIDTVTIPRLGRRRPWIIFAQGMMAATVLVIVTIPDLTTSLRALAWMILIHTVFNSMQDVAVDALAVDLLDENERGKANGMMYASKYLGGIIGGAGMSRVIAYSDLTTALIVQTSILIAIMFVPLMIRERPANVQGPEPLQLKQLASSLGQAFSIRSTLLGALLMLGTNVSLGALTANSFGLFTQDLGWDPEDYTDLVGGIGLAAGFAGAIMGGFLADLFGRRRMVAIGSLAMAAGWLTFALLRSEWNNTALMYGLAMWETLCTSVMTVSLFALCMDISWPRIAATQFTAYMALANLSTTLGYKLGGVVNSLWEYQGIYLIAAAAQISVTMILFGIDPGEARRKLPLPPGTPFGVVGMVSIAVFVGAVVVVPLTLIL